MDVGVAAQVSVSYVQTLKDCLVEAVSLDGKLNHGQTRLFPHLFIYLAKVNNAQVVFRIVL